MRDGMSKCLKRRESLSKSGAGASRLPTCKLFEQLLFLKDTLLNRPTESNIDAITTNDVPELLTPETNDLGSELPVSDYEITPQKRKKPAEGAKKKVDRRDSIDYLLVNALTKTSEANQISTGKITKDDENSNSLFCRSLIPILDGLPDRENRLAKIEIQQILVKYEFGDN